MYHSSLDPHESANPFRNTANSRIQVPLGSTSHDLFPALHGLFADSFTTVINFFGPLQQLSLQEFNPEGPTPDHFERLFFALPRSSSVAVLRTITLFPDVTGSWSWQGACGRS